MNQYRCETCEHMKTHTSKGGLPFEERCEASGYPPRDKIFENKLACVGCASHSDFQSEQDTVLELLRLKYVEFLNHPCPELADKYKHCCDADWCGLCTLDEVLAELRQKAGEQCGDNCKGECSGEVTGTPFCPQSERDTVLDELVAYKKRILLRENDEPNMRKRDFYEGLRRGINYAIELLELRAGEP